MLELPDLQVKGIEGHTGDLRRYLINGGAKKHARWFYHGADDDAWQAVIPERIPLMKGIKDCLNTERTRGTPVSSISGYLSGFQGFMKWVDENEVSISFNEELLKTLYLGYDEHLYFRAFGNKSIKYVTARNKLYFLSKIFNRLFNLPQPEGFGHYSRVLKSIKSKRPVSVSHSAEKQHLGDTQALGYYCVDVSNSLTIEAIAGQLPINIETLKPDGTTKNSQLPYNLVNHLNGTHIQGLEKAKKGCPPKASASYEDADMYRKSLIKTRLIAELVIFVFQTAMSMTQILKIKRKGFSYKSKGNSDWLVTEYKGRAGGPVSFTIYKEYKERFKDFISFVNHFYPDDPYLFPLSSEKMKLSGMVMYTQLTNILKRDGISWIPPRVARNTRVNFLDRLIGDPDVSAEIAQHTKEVFSEKYDRPSQQRAMSALTVFWEQNPISLINSGCVGTPEATDDKPSVVIEPNCIYESGCLWCKSHRDIESEDYVWSLASFRKLKLIEAAQPIKREIHADVIVDRLSEKLEAFMDLNEQSRQWTKEAFLRIEEGRYHPTWKSIINFWEPK